MIINKMQLLQAFIICSLLASCSLFDEEEKVPAYLHIPAIEKATEPGQGAATNNIDYVWVYQDQQFIGGYHLPITFPVLAEGTTNILIDPGVKENGLSFAPDVYPFYTRIEYNLDLQPMKVDTLNPVTTYRNTAVFSFIETFDSNNHLFTEDLDNDAQTSIEVTADGALHGTSGIIRLNEDHPVFAAGTNFDRLPLNDLPQDGSAVWMEVDYKTDMPIIFGVLGIEADGTVTDYPRFGINSRSEWNKIYFNLTDIIRVPEYVAFQIFVQGGLPLDATEGTVYLDNIKLVHF